MFPYGNRVWRIGLYVCDTLAACRTCSEYSGLSSALPSWHAKLGVLIRLWLPKCRPAMQLVVCGGRRGLLGVVLPHKGEGLVLCKYKDLSICGIVPLRLTCEHSMAAIRSTFCNGTPSFGAAWPRIFKNTVVSRMELGAPRNSFA